MGTTPELQNPRNRETDSRQSSARHGGGRLKQLEELYSMYETQV